MNEFEWLAQTRALKQPIDPPRDLWPGIAARLDGRGDKRRPARLLPWAMAAALAAVSACAGLLVWQQRATPAPRMTAHLPPAATAPWKPRDPHLVGAAIELNVAREQLARAIGEAPDDAWLRTMLEHANQQVRRLKQLPHRAG